MFQTLMLNFTYGIGGVIIGLIFMFVGFKIFDSLTNFDTSEQLKSGNVAVGIVAGSIFLSVSLMVSLIIGMALN